MADDRLKALRGSHRREFIKWSVAVGAALGIERARFLNVLNDTGGTALADEAKCGKTARSVHLIAGNGGLAWFTQLFPHVSVAKAGNANFAFYGAPTDVTDAQTDFPSVYGKFSPFKTLPRDKQMTMFVAGTNQTHTNQPTTGLTLGNSGLIAAIAAIQSGNPTLLPVMAINPFVYGTAAGAPTPATVQNAAGLVDLFSSVASRTLLKNPADANLHEAYYKAFVNLNAASTRPTAFRAYNTGRVSAQLLGKNLADQLRPTQADMQRYGVGAGTRTNVAEIANGLITAVKAFKMGLTSSLIMPAMRDDPHGAFQNMQTMTDTVTLLGKIFDAFMADCLATPDPSCQEKSLGDNIVMTITGDTPKNSLTKNGWPDGTQNNHNLVFAFGNGYLKTGWLGGLSAAGQVSTWDPATGQPVAGGNSGAMGTPAAASIAFAVARGDERRVSDFGVAVPKGPTVPQRM